MKEDKPLKIHGTLDQVLKVAMTPKKAPPKKKAAPKKGAAKKRPK